MIPSEHTPKTSNSEPEEAKPIAEKEGEIVKSVLETFSFKGPMHPAVYEKINEKHIDKILDNSENEDKRGYNYAREGRFLKYGFSLVIVIVLVLLTAFLAKDNTDLYFKIIQILVLFGGGIGVGKGFLGKKR